MPKTTKAVPTITKKAVDNFRSKGTTALSKVRNLVITNDRQLETARAMLQKVKNDKKIIHEKMDPVITNAHNLHKQLVGWRKEALNDYELADRVISKGMSDYVIKQRKIAQEEQEKLQRKAEEKAELERKRAIEKAKKKGDKEAVTELKQAPIVAQPVVPKTEVPKVNGFSVREIPDFEVVDENLVPVRFRKVDLVAIRKEVNQLGMKAQIPGVKVFMKGTVR